MDFVRGGELSCRIKSIKRLDEETAKFYAYQVIVAIKYLHKKKIIYRDLKPENVLIGEDGYLKLADFGLAKYLAEGDSTKTMWGTPEYLAPEIIRREHYDNSIDWWTVGVFIYEMVIGIPPFYNKSHSLMFDKILNDEVRFPSKEKYSIEISDAWQDLIKSLLNKDPKNRLGADKGAKMILSHPWFLSLERHDIDNKTYKPSYTPELSDDIESVDNFYKYFSYMSIKSKAQNMKKKKEEKTKFRGFTDNN